LRSSRQAIPAAQAAVQNDLHVFDLFAEMRKAFSTPRHRSTAVPVFGHHEDGDVHLFFQALFR